MAKEESEELKALRMEWLGNPYTQAQIPKLQKDFAARLNEFLHDASMSTDPKVAHSYRRFVESQVLLAMFTRGTPEARTLADSVAGAVR